MRSLLAAVSLFSMLSLGLAGKALAQQDDFKDDWGDWGLEYESQPNNARGKHDSGTTPQYGVGIENTDAANLHKLDRSSLLDYDNKAKGQEGRVQEGRPYPLEQPSTLDILMQMETTSEWERQEQHGKHLEGQVASEQLRTRELEGDSNLINAPLDAQEQVGSAVPFVNGSDQAGPGLDGVSLEGAGIEGSRVEEREVEVPEVGEFEIEELGLEIEELEIEVPEVQDLDLDELK